MVRLKLTPFWVGNNLQSHLPHTQFCGEADLSQYRFILYSVLDIGYCESHLMIRAGEGGRNDVQGSAKRRGLGSWLCLAVAQQTATLPHLFADLCRGAVVCS